MLLVDLKHTYKDELLVIMDKFNEEDLERMMEKGRARLEAK